VWPLSSCLLWIPIAASPAVVCCPLVGCLILSKLLITQDIKITPLIREEQKFSSIQYC
jgi:hypothetical protein